MKITKLLLVAAFLAAPGFAHAKGHLFGFNASLGMPVPTSFGLNYVHSSGLFSAEAATGSLSIAVSDVSVAFTRTELILRYHPFAGSFFVGAGFGQMKLSAEQSETISGGTVRAKIDLTANTLTPTLGWMWGIADGGFFAGLDFGMQSPSGGEGKLDTNADASVQATQEYQDLVTAVDDQAKKFGELSLPVVTLLRIGYLF